MATFGLPADLYAQSDFSQWEPTPPPPVPSGGAEPPAASLPVPHEQTVAWQAPVVTVLPIRAT